MQLMKTNWQNLLLSALIVLGCMAGGGGQINTDPKYVNVERATNGLVIILPGIEGESSANRNIREGLFKSGIPYSLEIFRWGVPTKGVISMMIVSLHRFAGMILGYGVLV